MAYESKGIFGSSRIVDAGDSDDEYSPCMECGGKGYYYETVEGATDEDDMEVKVECPYCG